MSFLTPLYALGALAIAAPILFHLIRRSPTGEVPFSSLMFLAPTPPRLTRRSRLDSLLLLLLRAAALGLLAFAFARPFLRQALRLDNPDAQRRRVAVLIDTSASLRRANLWTRAKALALETVASCRPADQLAVFAFDATSRPVLSFDESGTLDPARRQAVARARIEALAPGWGGTQLGQALIDTVGAVEDVADTSEKTGRMPRKIVLVSDLQQGSRLEALGDFEWPSDVELELKTVADTGANAGLHPLPQTAEPEPSGSSSSATPSDRELKHRVRVSNDAASRAESFTLSWVDEAGSALGTPTPAYVPPGESRVVKVPRPPGQSARRTLRLAGDASGFDNTLFFVDERKDDVRILYVGSDAADDPAGLLYYLMRVYPETPRRTVHVETSAPSAALTQALEPAKAAERPPALVIVAGETTGGNAERLARYARDGGTVLDVLTAPGAAAAATLAALAGAEPSGIAIDEAPVKGDVMFGEVDFGSPLFSSLAPAQFNDFTKIHFWKYRRLDPKVLGADVRVLARFENGDAAVVAKTVGKGTLVVFCSGWQPVDSQLARSSKFVPLMAGLLDDPTARPLDEASRLVGDRVTLPAEGRGQRRLVHKPDGGAVALAQGSVSFDQTDEPGVYTVDTAEGPRSFAVNLDPLESKTSSLHLETLEQFGCRLASPARQAIDREHRRQMQNLELEGRQKLWRWIIVAAIGVLIVETWLAGVRSRTRSRPARAEALTT